MIYPDYFDDNETQEKIINLYRQLEDFILRDIADRLLKNSSMTATADRLIWRLQQMGESREKIMRKLQEITKLSRKELRTLLQDAVLTSWEDEKPFYDGLGVAVSDPLANEEVVRIMDAQYRKSLGELSNLTRTTMEQSQKDLMNMLSEYDMRIAAGVQSPTSAVCEILDRYAGHGIEVLYPTGTKRTLEAAVRCCITTSAMQMTGQVTAQYIGQYGVEYVCTSAHMGARVAQKGQPPLAGHDNWQGRIFKIRGSEPGFPNLLESTGYDIVDGTGKVVNPLGLYGYNCKHSVQPCSKDSRNPWRDKDGNLIIGGEKIDSEKNRKAYEISQKARYMERSIRETKRKLLMKEKEINGVAETDVKEILQPEYDKLAYKLRMQNKRYNEFCEENGLKKQYDRIKKSGFDRKQSAKANGAATRYENQNGLPKETDRFKAGNREPKNSTESSVPQNITSDILYGKKVKDFTKTAKEINAELDSICIRESKWSGRIIIDDKLRALGQKEWNCDIKLVPKADYATELHELLHARSASYYDAKTYKKYRKMEEGTVELLTEEICKKKEISFTSAYVEELKHLRRINRRAKLYMDEYSFAVDLLNIPLVDRSKWLIKRINNNYAKGMLTGAEREGAFDSLVKILEEID